MCICICIVFEFVFVGLRSTGVRELDEQCRFIRPDVGSCNRDAGALGEHTHFSIGACVNLVAIFFGYFQKQIISC